MTVTDLGEGDVGGDGEERLVVDLRLDPVHEEGDVLGRGQVDRLLVLHSVLKSMEWRGRSSSRLDNRGVCFFV